MKYQKARVQVIHFKNNEFMAGSGNWDGGYCKNYGASPRNCGYVTHCTSYSIAEGCRNWFECDDYGPFSIDMGFLCIQYA